MLREAAMLDGFVALGGEGVVESLEQEDQVPVGGQGQDQIGERIQ